MLCKKSKPFGFWAGTRSQGRGPGNEVNVNHVFDQSSTPNPYETYDYVERIWVYEKINYFLISRLHLKDDRKSVTHNLRSIFGSLEPLVSGNPLISSGANPLIKKREDPEHEIDTSLTHSI